MKRFARVATLCLVGTLCAGAAAHAQTTTASGSSTSDESPLYVEFNVGPTLGHKSDTFIGGEFGMPLVSGLDLFVEGGRMGNVGTSKLDDDAAKIASFVGGTVSSSAYKATYFDAGVRYHLNIVPSLRPYVLAGAGLAHVTTEVAFAVNGTVVDPAQFGVQLGGDLSGGTNKVIIIVGGGVNIPFMKRYFADLGYRYGQILAKTGDIETDKGIKTQRVVFGFGVRF